VSSSFTFTSESVTEGHPDKMADQISDSILDALLAEDPNSRVACETFVTTGLCIVGGEITTEAYVDIPSIVRQTICDIGYDRESYGYDGHTVGVLVALDEQSPDIAQGVNQSEEVRSGQSGEDILNKQGAGDQGMMFGYACGSRSTSRTAWLNGLPRCVERGRSRTCGPTARRRSPSITRTGDRFACAPSWCPPNTTTEWSGTRFVMTS